MRREEIAAWLREESLNQRAVALACLSGLLPKRFYSECLDKADLLDERAAQVEAMLCETCKYYVHRVGGINDFCLKINEVYDMGPDFGCFAHEQKPAG